MIAHIGSLPVIFKGAVERGATLRRPDTGSRRDVLSARQIAGAGRNALLVLRPKLHGNSLKSQLVTFSLI